MIMNSLQIFLCVVILLTCAFQTISTTEDVSTNSNSKNFNNGVVAGEQLRNEERYHVSLVEDIEKKMDKRRSKSVDEEEKSPDSSTSAEIRPRPIFVFIKYAIGTILAIEIIVFLLNKLLGI